MKNVSSAFREELKKDNRNYIKSADITLKSGTVLKVDNSDLWQNGMKLDTATSNPNSFDLGAIITGQLTLTLNNIDEKFSDYDFTDCTATNVKVGLKLPDGTTESLSYGKFYLNEAKYNGSIITLTFYDSIYKFDQPYSKSNLTYPATLGQILRDACSVCGVPMGTVEFDNDDYVVQSRPDDKSLTFRQVLKWIGEISVHYFFADEEGRLSVGWYDLESQNNQIEETILQDTDGENILDTNNDEIITSIESGIRHFVSLSVGLDDVVITGVRVLHDVEGDSGTETITYQAGNDGYLIEISKNKLIQGDEGTNVANMVAAKLVGLRFRAYQATGLSDPTREVGDTVWLIDRKNNIYKSVITNNTFQPGNFQNFSCGAVSPARNSATRYSQITQVYVDYRKDIEKERTDREKALDELAERIDGSSGLFTTEEIQEDGSTIFYLHNKPMLSESDIIWKMTAEAWGVSTDGGKTYNAGMTVDGDTIVRILTAVGVNADWIKTGAFRIEKNGEVMFSADTETGIIDIVANSFTLKGKSIEDIAENQVNDFVDAIYTPTIDNIQKQIDGQIETYYYDYEPTLSNVPAIDWTSEEERKSHEGDLFYWKSRGYAYRFFKDGDTWKWQMVQDTDITKALEQAAEAQDTADQKRRVFVVTPNPPYDVGDLWVGNNTSDLMRCQRARSSGSYNADDWIKAVKYTDDTELNNFIREDYSETIQEILNSVDKKAQTWYQTTDPSLDWASTEESVLQDTDGNSILDSENNDIITLWEKEKSTHDGDLWRNPANNTEYMYVDGNWVEMSIPDEVFDTIDGKAQIFVTQPVPPYDVGDTWFTGTTILVCDTRRDSGEFVAEDWSKQDNYTDDSALYEFMEGDYKQTIEELQTQADSKAETWYQPTDPSDLWSNEEKLRHDGDIWYNTSSQKTYIYNGSSWEETKSNPPDEVFDTIDGKAQIFVSQPVPPYAVGDLWFDSASSDIMTCIYSRESGNFNAGDWQKRNKYTDDSALQNFLSGEYSETITELKTQADKKAETWYQGTDPSTSWNATQKAEHEGDLWYNTSNQKTYIYDGSAWQETKSTPPDEVFDEIDGKAQIFVRQPVPPYSVGDLWFNSATSDIMTCITARPSGSYNEKDWEKRNKYTDDSYAEEVAGNLSNFADQVVGDLENMQTQIDGKIETYYYDYQPTLTNIPASAWTTETERQKHIGDLFYYKSTGFTYRFLKDGSTWKWQPIKDEDISKALSDAADAQDTADSKRRVFTSTPTPPYDVGDLWAQGSSGDIMRCIRSRSSGNYTSSDWDKASKYTDDSAVEDLDTSLDKQGVFDRLTNYGEVKGIFLESDGQLYINASYLMTGILKVSQPGASGKETFYANMDTGEVRIVANSFSLKGKSISEIADEEVNDFIDNVYSPTISNLQSQIDGQIETWFYNYVPTTSNAPASNWTTDSEKERHLGDLFYVVDNEEYGGQAYRWAKINNAYTWDYVEDTAVTKALANAAAAQDTADQKRRVFVSQPVPPYDVGDLWVGNSSSDLMRCQTSRQSGNYNAADWTKAVKYTDDSELQAFIQGDYADTIEKIKTQADQKSETWYQATDPSASWSTADKAKHKGDLWYNTSNQKTYIYDGSAWRETKSTPPDEVFDEIDGKAQIFVRQPVPPYSVGDLWFNSATSDIMTCITARPSGSYNAKDWEKRNKYTDDSYAQEINDELNRFIEDYNDEIQEIANSIDKKSETWYQTSDPADQWTDNVDNDPLLDTNGNNITDTTGENITTIWEKEKTLHDGDLWHNPNTNKEYIYVDGEWKETSIPDDVFDIIDGKAQIFVSTPTPPYAIGDLWFNSTTSDIMTCINGRESGSYASSDWQKRNKYTDDSYAEEVAGDLSNFADQVVGDLENMQTQIDGKIETYYYDYQPTLTNIPASAWTTETERQKHIGDLFYYKSTGFTYRFLKDGSTWKWQPIKDEDISKALSDAADAQDTADSKRRVFTSTPTPPYDVGDLWAQGSSGDIMRCIRSRSSGNYTSSDWDKASKYTDDSAVEDLDTSLDKQGVFDRLTNYGEVKGIFLESDGQLYINASYLMTGILKVSQPGASGKETFYANMDTGEVRIVANSFSLTNGDTIDSIAQSAVDELDDSLTQTDIFNRLTGNKANEAIILQNGHIYINASYLNTGILQVSTASGTETLYVNVDTGEVRINATSFSLTDGRTIDSIADNAKSEAIQYTDERLSDYDPADDLTQQEVFNILTNGGITQGIYLNGGRVYVNASYIGAGTLDADRIDAKGLTVYNTSGTRTLYIDNNGNVSINANSLMLSGSSVNSIANNAANNALQDAKDYTDLQIENFDPDLTQQEVFNILTNGGTTQGIYLSGGKIYINASYIGSGTISASRIAANSITASKLNISDLYAIGATIGGFVLGSQGMRSSNSSLRLWSDGRIQIGACVLSANSNAFQVRYGLHIYCDPSVFSDGSGYFKIFNLAHVTSGGHLVFNSDGATVAYLSSSSKRYKNHISDVPDEEALRILDIPVIKFKYKDGYLFPTDFLVDKEIPGFYAEDVEEVNPILCQYNEDGSVEDWNYRTMIPYMLKTMQIQQKQIDNLQTQINELKTMILNMKGA